MNILGFASSLFGTGLSMFGAKQTQKQYLALMEKQMQIAQNNLESQRQLAAPFLQAGLEGLAGIKRVTQDAYANMFKENETLNQSRDLALSNLNRATAKNTANTSMYFANNEGRARGEQTRNERAGAMAKNQVLLDWSRQSESDKMRNTQTYLAGSSSLGNYGQLGTNIMTNAYNTSAMMQSQALQQNTPPNR